MNKLRLFVTGLAAILIVSTADAQKAAYTTNGGITIGFGVGATYQQSDIANSIGAGFDFQFGSSLYKKSEAFLAIDWRFRFLAGENIAYDHRINPDLTYNNIRYSFYDYDLELGLTLNRLRERTRIVLTGFAGLGITHGRTFTDMLDANGDPYDYTSIGAGLSRNETVAALISLSDNEFETAVTNKAVLMPTAGIYLGYQFSRSFSIGIEHKINFSMNENNGAFGINMDNVIVDSPIDMNHYTSLTFRWALRGGRSGRSSNTSYPQVEKSPVVYDSPVKPVIVERTERPVRRDTTSLLDRNRTPLSTASLQTQAGNTRPVTITDPVVVNQQNVTQQNVVQQNVSVENPTRPGTTRPATSATNPAPVIRFVDPASAVTVDRNRFLLRVQTSNVAAWQDVDVKQNGVSNSSFSFAPNGVVTLNMALREGDNRIEVTAKNQAGTVSESTVITYTKPVTAITNPVTTVTNPVTTTTNPVTTVTNPVTTTTNPVTTVTNPVTTVTNPVTTTTNPVTTTTTNPVTTTTNPVTTTTNPVTTNTNPVTTVTNPVTTTTNPVTTATNPVTTTTNPVTTTTTNPVTTTTNPVTTVTNPVTTVTNPVTVVTEPEVCGVRINPGNADWQFCLITPSGTFNRSTLSNKQFTYSGSASSLFMMPIAGGGNAKVNGRPYNMKSGSYYLFTGNLRVTVSTSNAGSMGHWSICIEADSAPQTGNGNNRPKSPCEEGGGKK